MMSLGLYNGDSISFRIIPHLEAMGLDEIGVERLGEVGTRAEVAYVGSSASLGDGHDVRMFVVFLGDFSGLESDR